MAGTDALWLTEADVAGLMDMGTAIAALERGLAQEAAGQAKNMVKTHQSWGKQDTLHAIGAVFEGSNIIGTKTWAHTEGGACPLLILFDASTGKLRAVIEAFVMGQFRTGGITGVATKWLARPDAGVLMQVGTGKQAITQVAAVAAVRKLKEVRIFGRDVAKRDAFIARVAEELGLKCVAASGIADGCNGADIVTVVTRAREPIITGNMLAPGTHFNAVGAITPERMEFAPPLLTRAAAVVADSVPQVQKLSREFMDFYGNDQSRWTAVQPLSQLVAAAKPRAPDADLTVFKAMGMGISDLSLGIDLLERATKAGIGRPVPQPTKVKPRLTAA